MLRTHLSASCGWASHVGETKKYNFYSNSGNKLYRWRNMLDKFVSKLFNKGEKWQPRVVPYCEKPPPEPLHPAECTLFDSWLQNLRDDYTYDYTANHVKDGYLEVKNQTLRFETDENGDGTRYL